MKGIQHVEVSNKRAKFKFDLYRNITIVRGDSGSGKTTLYNLIAAYTREKAASGVNLSSTKPCVALLDMDWENQLRNTTDSIVFIDEGAAFISSKEFAHAVKHSDNYYVIFNRESLHELPYSVTEIYEIKTSGRYHSFKRMYPEKSLHRYTSVSRDRRDNFQVLLTEDSQSGYEFFQQYFQNSPIQCVSARTNSAIFKWLSDHPQEGILVVADGAAFGSQMDRVMKLCQAHAGAFQLCLPESFEWLLLKSGLVHADDLATMLENPSEYIESEDFFSWENYFTDYLVQNTIGTPFQYTKSRLNPVYTQENNRKRIAGEILKDKEE